MSDIYPFLDLASERLGGRVTYVTDEFFAAAQNMLKPGRGVFIEGRYTDRGKWMDGWESRRRRDGGHDWCVIRLGFTGMISRLCVDTNHFRGNNPESCSIELGCIEHEPGEDAAAWEHLDWTPLLPRSPLQPSTEHFFDVRAPGAASHLRLQIYPDGGVARFRAFGHACPDWQRRIDAGEEIDLVGAENGGRPIACSDQFFSEPWNLLMPGRSEHMGDGWETRRRRGPGHDWVILALGHRGLVREIEIDTNHFKGNYPDSCSIEAIELPNTDAAAPTETNAPWRTLLANTKLGPHMQHYFRDELTDPAPITHIRFNIFPDGGVSRLRVRGRALPVE